MEKCSICETRRSKRACPALGKDICPQCCAAGREETISCPMDCSYLVESRDHETLVKPETLPHSDVVIADGFMQRNQPLFMLVAATLKQSAEEAGAIDSDAQQAIAALAQKYRAKESTLVYEPTLANPIASRIYELFDEKIESFKTRVAAEGGGALSFLDNMFKVLVHLERMSALRSNGRTRGRHFLSLLWKMFPSKNKEAQAAAQ